MSAHGYDLNSVDGIKTLLEDTLGMIDVRKLQAILEKNFPDQAEQLMGDFNVNVREPLLRANSLLAEAISVTGRTTAKQKLDYARYRKDQPKLSDEMVEVLNEETFRAISKAAAGLAYALHERIAPLNQAIEEGHGRGGNKFQQISSQISLLTEAHDQLSDIKQLTHDASADIDVRYTHSAIKTLHTKVKNFERRVREAHLE